MRIVTTLLTGLLLLPPALHAEMLWQPAPSSGGHGHGHGGGGQRGLDIVIKGAPETAKLTLWSPTLEQQPLSAEEGGGVRLPRTGFDNYHALVAEYRSDRLVQVALRYLPRRGKPSGWSPVALVETPKATLELVPTPLPREHRRHYSSEPVAFELRFNGEPLADSRVSLTTSNGTLLEGSSDANGHIRFTLPEDFRRIMPGRSNNRPAEFTLRAGHVGADGLLYRTNLTSAYWVNPSHWQSTAVGGFVLGAGFIVGLLLTRVREAEGKS